jgi:hypothetical protein
LTVDFERDEGERLDLFGVGTGDPGDGLTFEQALHAGHVIRCALAVWKGRSDVMLVSAGAFWALELVGVLVLWALGAALQWVPMQLFGGDAWMGASVAALWVLLTLFRRFLRELLEAGVVTAVGQVSWEGSWTFGALFFAVGPAVRRILVQVVGSAVLAIPGGLFAAVAVGAGWATLWPIIESGEYSNPMAWLSVGVMVAIVVIVGGSVMLVLWAVVWLVLQPAIVAATVGMNPFAAVAYSTRKMRTGWVVILGLNALYGVALYPLAVFTSSSSLGCVGFIAVLIFGVPVALLHTSWFAGTTLAWMRHARSSQSWPVGGVGQTMLEVPVSPGASGL